MLTKSRHRRLPQSAHTLKLKFAAMGFDIVFRAVHVAVPIPIAAAAAVEVLDHGIEQVHVVIRVVVDRGASGIHPNVLCQAVSYLRSRKQEVCARRRHGLNE